MGMIAVLHTWGQNLSLHPHLHCIVPGGGITNAGYWKNTKSKGRFLFDVKYISKVFRAKFKDELKKQLPQIPQFIFDKMFKVKWVVHSKRTTLKPETIIEYLARYTYKVAISNYRLLDIDKKKQKGYFLIKRIP